MENLVVCKGKGAKEEVAREYANRLQVPLVEEPGEQLTLLVDETGLSLTGFGLTFQGDFEQMLHRLTGGRLQHEMLVHVAKTKLENPKAVDCTAGMGEDAILLAASGYEVTLFEQNPVIAALLQDAMDRAKDHEFLGPVMNRMHLIQGNSVEILPTLEEKFDLIYLDPMFPARQKSGLVTKKLQLIQKLEQPCSSEEELFAMAVNRKPGKIVVKRPLKGANLAGKKPSYTIKGKAIRYDCFVYPENDRNE